MADKFMNVGTPSINDVQKRMEALERYFYRRINEVELELFWHRLVISVLTIAAISMAVILIMR